MQKNRNLLISILALAVVTSFGSSEAWDLTRPITDLFPEPIGIAPEDLPKQGAPEAVDPTFEEEIMMLVNQERWSNGQLPPLKQNDALDSAAELHSGNMAARNFVMHCDPDTGTLPWDRMVAAGYTYSNAGENIAWGYPDPQSVVAGWMGSSGHRANILSTTFRELGNGYVYQAGDQGNVRRSSVGGASCNPDIFGEGPFFRYWTQNFGKRNSTYPVVINREDHLTESRDVSLYLYGGFSEMRLRNENGAWTDWQSFSNNTAWQLSSGNGVKTVHVEVTSGGTVYSASDTIYLENTSEIIFIDGFETGDTAAWSVP
jgi:uncharacterized protein YkwD